MKKLIIYFLGIFLLFAIGKILFKGNLSKLIPGSKNFTSGFSAGIPVFASGIFSNDGNYFAYTYRPEIKKPEVNGNVKISGFAFPTFFQIIDCKTGKKLLNEPFDGGKRNQLYVVWEEDNLVWLMHQVYNKNNSLALYDLKANKFRFEFGSLEKENPGILDGNISIFFINTTPNKGLLFEGNDKRYYRLDPNTGKATTIQGKPEMLSYIFAKNFQVSDSRIKADYKIRNINGNRESITDNQEKNISQDDFIDAKFLTITKNKTAIGYEGIPITFYKNYFFVLSPVLGNNIKDMELSMLDKNTLKTAWKLQLPQKTLQTFTPYYGFERFSLNNDQMLVSNNDYLLTIDLTNGNIVHQVELYN